VFEYNGMSAAVKDLLARLPAGVVAPASTVPAVVPVLPVPAVLRSLFPRGLRRGTTIEVALGGSTTVDRDRFGDQEPGEHAESAATGGCTLLVTLLAGASGGGSWCALVGAPWLGLAAAAEAGVDLSRLALVPAPGRAWARVVGALLDGFDLVAVRPPVRFAPADARALSARARNHGAVLVALGPWPGSDLRLVSDADVWEGLGNGHGRFHSRRMSVCVSGRGAMAGCPARAELRLSAADEPALAGRSSSDPPASRYASVG
jgi:hypothetical protein